MRLLAGLAVALALLAAAGCGGQDEPGTALRLVVPDNNIRVEGSECSGAIPFRHVHRGTAYRIEALDGELLAEGELPSGVARNADPKIDWESDRMPTVCTMDLDVDLPARPRYRFVIDRSRPVEFDAPPPGRAEPTLVVLGG